MIKRLVYKENMRSHDKLSSNTNTSSLAIRKALLVTVTTYEFICIITQRHSKDSILNHTPSLTEETRKLEQCRVVKELTHGQGSNKCGFPLNKSLFTMPHQNLQTQKIIDIERCTAIMRFKSKAVFQPDIKIKPSITCSCTFTQHMII